jgi:hypothetical protein
VAHAAASAETLKDLKQVAALLTVANTGLVPGDLTAADAAELVGVCARIERLAAGARTLAVHEVVSSGIWKDLGAKNAACWLAEQLGITVGEAHRILGTSERVRSQPKTADALRKGELSDDQADAVSGATGADPESEDENIAAAKEKKESVRELRERRERAKARADKDDGARERRIHRDRTAHRSIGADGSFQAFMKCTKAQGARFSAAWDAHITALMAERAGNGQPKEPYGALALDGLLRMADHSLDQDHRAGAEPPKAQREPEAAAEPATEPSEDAPADPEPATPEGPEAQEQSPQPAPDPPQPRARPGPRAEMVWLVSLEALQRGWVEGDEVCEIPGVGPVPVSAAREVLGEADLHLVITRGKDIASYCHLGEISPSQRAAVYARARGRCERPGCTSTTHLQIDHIWERQHGGPTRLDNLRLLCGTDHRMKTNNGWRLIGPPGQGTWTHSSQLPGDPARGYPMNKLKHLFPPEEAAIDNAA